MEEVLKISIKGEDSGLGKVSQSSTKALENLGRAADTTNVKLKLAGKGSAEATNALTNLSRIAQDAPFGFIGIANNINPMLESFQRLQKESGGTGKALKAMAGSLSGAGGLGLAIGVASSLAVVLGDKLFSAGQAISKAAKEADKYKQSMAEAFSSVAQEATQVEVLVATLKREVLTREQRSEAIKQLQQIAPAYFNTLNAEKFNVEQLTISYDNYTRSLRKAAEGKVLEKQLEGIIAKRLELEKVLNPDQFIIDDQGRRVRNFIYEDAAAIRERSKTQQEYNGLLRTEEVIANRLSQIKPPSLVTPLKEIKVPKVKLPKIELVEKVRVDEIILQPDRFTIGNKDINFDAGELKNVFNRLKNIKPVDIKPRVNVAPAFEGGNLPEQIQKFIQDSEMAQKISEAINTSLQNIKIQALTGLGEAIGAAFTGGGLDDAIKALGATMGSAIGELGKQLISLGVVATGVQKSFAALLTNPLAMIGSGVALVALGQAFKNISIPKLADGGIIPGGFSGDRFPAMLNSGEAVIPLDKLWAQLEGMDLGGGSHVLVTGRLRGNDLLLQNERSKRSRNRRG